MEGEEEDHFTPRGIATQVTVGKVVNLRFASLRLSPWRRLLRSSMSMMARRVDEADHRARGLGLAHRTPHIAHRPHPDC